jgi:hypothetical protein
MLTCGRGLWKLDENEMDGDVMLELSKLSGNELPQAAAFHRVARPSEAVAAAMHKAIRLITVAGAIFFGAGLSELLTIEY